MEVPTKEQRIAILRREIDDLRNYRMDPHAAPNYRQMEVQHREHELATLLHELAEAMDIVA